MSYDVTLKTFRQEDALSYYLLGAFLTDGNVYSRKNKTTEVSLASKDLDWLESINLLLANEGKLRKKKTCFSLIFYNAEIYDWLKSHGVTENKSLTIQLPEIPSQYFRDFVRGCLDGDGSISFVNYTKKKRDKTYKYKKVTTYICSSAPLFVNSLSQSLAKLGFDNQIIQQSNHKRKIHYKHPHYRVQLNDSNAVKFLAWIDYPSCHIALSRKSLLTDSILAHYDIIISK